MTMLDQSLVIANHIVGRLSSAYGIEQLTLGKSLNSFSTQNFILQAKHKYYVVKNNQNDQLKYRSLPDLTHMLIYPGIPAPKFSPTVNNMYFFMI